MEQELLVEENVKVVGKDLKSDKNSKEKKLPNLDPLRFFLAFIVVISHVPGLSKSTGVPFFDKWDILEKGGQAVCVFFALSGFLIIKLLFIEKEKTGTVNIRHFYMRRILRIYPVYYIILTFGLLFYCFVLPRIGVVDEVTKHVPQAIALAVGFMPNVLNVLYKVGGVLFILWSIGIEEQFYLLIAPVVKFLNIKHIPWVLAAFTVIYLAIFCSPVFEPYRKFKVFYYFFSMGGLVSILEYKGKINFLKFGPTARLLLYSAFIASFFIKFEKNAVPDVLVTAVYIILFSLTILNLSTDDTYIIKNKFLNYLGKISYGIYMYHVIAIYIVLFLFMKFEFISNALGFTPTILVINIATFAISILIAHLSFVLIEKRILKLKEKVRHV